MTPIRLAIWSGPRNISTAMMRSFDARPGTVVCDEPLYAYYLEATGRPHPGAAEVIARHETDPERIIAWLTGPIPDGCDIFYQKHMAHHLLPDLDRAWLAALVNCFLIRSPRAMLTSLARVIPNPTVEETGLPQQVELFERERERTGRTPPVIDCRDVLTDPAGTLAALCDAVGIPFTERMLHWPAGPRPTDGVWARHWYDAVERSTGFQPYRAKDDKVPAHLAEVLDACEALYETLHRHRLSGPASPLAGGP